MIMDAFENVGKIVLRVEVVEFGGLDDGHRADQGFRADLPPEAPSFITRVCGFGFHIVHRQFGQARRAQSPQVAQAPGALQWAFCSRGTSAV